MPPDELAGEMQADALNLTANGLMLLGAVPDAVEVLDSWLGLSEADYGDHESLRQALSDPERLRQWGQEGARQVQGYSYARAAEGLEAALQVLWEGKPWG